MEGVIPGICTGYTGLTKLKVLLVWRGIRTLTGNKKNLVVFLPKRHLEHLRGKKVYVEVYEIIEEGGEG